jgi:hypothetical protein
MSVLAQEKKPGWQKIGFLYRLDVVQEKKPGWQKTGFQFKKPGF